MTVQRDTRRCSCPMCTFPKLLCVLCGRSKRKHGDMPHDWTPVV